jgi:hypothetical protein
VQGGNVVGAAHLSLVDGAVELDAESVVFERCSMGGGPSSWLGVCPSPPSMRGARVVRRFAESATSFPWQLDARQVRRLVGGAAKRAMSSLHPAGLPAERPGLLGLRLRPPLRLGHRVPEALWDPPDADLLGRQLHGARGRLRGWPESALDDAGRMPGTLRCD